ncbi:MAG: methyltransferase domain-containing protein [Chlamydiota bacterium]
MKNLKNTDRWNAEYYKKNSSKQFQRGMEVLNAMQFKEDEIVLDVGCGDGRLTFEIAKRIPKGKVLGIDISANMIHEAQKSFSDISNLSFECIDSTKFEAKNRFDRAISFAAFHWIDDQFKALKNIYAALKPGGHLYIEMLTSDKTPALKAMESPKWHKVLQSSKAHFQGQSPETIMPLLEKCGFVTNDVQVKAKESVFKNQKEMCDWLMGWIPHGTGLSEDRAQEFVQDITQTAKNAPGDLVFIGYSLHVSAQKPG